MSADENRPRLRAATYNVHGCVGMDRQRSEARIAEVIASLAADVVGLQELDSSRARSGSADQAALIAQQLGWKHFFHPAMQNGAEQYGDAIVSRLPFIVKRAEELPGTAPWYCREKRVAIWLEMETPLGPVELINTHFGLGRNERVLQAEWLLSHDWLGSLDPVRPAVLLGDFNSVRTSRAYRVLGRALRDVRTLVRPRRAFRTYPTRLPALAVDHIFVNDHLHPTDLQVHRTPVARVASDHFPLIAELTKAEPER